MALIGRLHPLLLHSPIALVVIVTFAELVAIVRIDRTWHVVAVANVRAAGAFAVAAALSGWLLASSSLIDDVRSLEWHRWIGTTAAVATIGAALATAGIDGPLADSAVAVPDRAVLGGGARQRGWACGRKARLGCGLPAPVTP